MLYNTLVAIVVVYSAFCGLFALVMISYEFRYGLGNVAGRRAFLARLNKLSGKKVVTVFRWISFIALFSWLALALPLIDFIVGQMVGGGLITTYTNYPSSVLHTYFGDITGAQSNAYFATVFFTIIGVKGFWLLEVMTAALKDDLLVANKFGRWGSSTNLKS
jgi:hypothetical protein